MSKDTAPAEDNRKLVGPLAILIDLVITAVFFAAMTKVSYGHTPDFSPTGKWIFAAYTSLCLTGVFWICLQCFRVTLIDQCRRKKAGVQS
jgi:hypothetical protein